MNVFELFAKLNLDTKEYESGLNDAKTKGQKWASGVAKGAKIGAAAVAAVGTAVIGAGVAFTKQTGEVAEYGDHIDKMSQKIGISAKAYQEWDAIMKHSGASIDSLRPAMKTLATQAQKNSEEFKKLGISERDVANLSTEDLFAKVVSGLQNMEEGTERTYIASKLLGRGATELGALLNTSAEDTEAMRQKVHELGGVMSDEAVKAAAKYQDALQDLQTGIQGLKRNLVADFLPGVTAVMEGLTEIISGDTDKGVEIISGGIDELVNGISEKLPVIIEVAGKIIQALLKAIVTNLPKIFESGTDVIMELVDGLIKNLPTIVDAGIKAIVALIKGIAKALPRLIPSIVKGVMLIAETIIQNLPLLLDAVLEVIKGLAKGIVQAFPIIIEELPKLIKGIVDFLLDSIPDIIDAGIELLYGLIDAIPDVIVALVDALPQIIEGIVDALLDPDNLEKMIKAGIELFVAIVSSPIRIIAAIAERIPEIVENIKDEFNTSVQNGDFEEIGRNMIKGVFGGIVENLDAFTEGALAFFGIPIEQIKSMYQIMSPSKVTRNLFSMVGKGAVLGLEDMKGDMDDTAENFMSGVDDAFNRDYDLSYRMNDLTTDRSAFVGAQDGYLGGSDNYEEEIIIPHDGSDSSRDITIVLQLDDIEFGRAVYKANNEETQRVGVRLVGAV